MNLCILDVHEGLSTNRAFGFNDGVTGCWLVLMCLESMSGTFCLRVKLLVALWALVFREIHRANHQVVDSFS